MSIVLLSAERDLAVTGADIVRLFYPEEKIVYEPATDSDIVLSVAAGSSGKALTATAELTTFRGERHGETATDMETVTGDERNQQKRLVKLAVFRLLSRYTGREPAPWGILTGIRPTKIVHRLMDKDRKRQEILDFLTENYDMAPAKAELLIDIAGRQRPFLPNAEQAARNVSVYLGIPFCPTRCAYCSFPSYPVEQAGQLMEPFMQALFREITGVGAFFRERGINVQTVYVGGGTPTVLSAERLEDLLQHIGEKIVSAGTVEITLEAGRPDTLTEAKLTAAKKCGVTRLSINPQSMNPGTLATIGRRHTPGQVLDSVAAARKLGFGNINMDVIIGLPGEKTDDVRHTLDAISELRPENLTVHTLAVKRSSLIREDREAFSLPGREEVERMQETAAQAAAEMRMLPYYLYRQKKMVGPLENTGYALPGHECLYNIQIIEERQTIIGLGGGAGSKFVEPGTWYLTSHYNPKDPETYINRVDELVSRKLTMLDKVISKEGVTG